MAKTTVRTVRADRFGIPTAAVCAGCGEIWRRTPATDPAYELALFAAEHEGQGCGDLEAEP